MEAQTIAQIHQQTQQSLWAFLLALPTSEEAEIFYALLLGASLGMFAHYFRRWATGDIEGGLFDYLLHQHPRATALAVGGILIELGGEVGTGLFTTDAGAFVGWGLVLLSGLKTGYMGDSIANKGTPINVTKEGVQP